MLGSVQKIRILTQIDALKKAGVDEVHTEIVSGAKSDRPVLAETLKGLRSGGILVIWKLDRLGRSLRHLVALVPMLLERGVGLLSLNDHIDTTTPHGRFTSHFQEHFILIPAPPRCPG